LLAALEIFYEYVSRSILLKLESDLDSLINKLCATKRYTQNLKLDQN